MHIFWLTSKLISHVFHAVLKSCNHRKNAIIEIENFPSSNPNHFWDSIKKLGLRKREDIPKEVYDNDNNIVTDLPNVFNKWKFEFESLYNLCPEPENFDDEFYSECMSDKDTDNEDYFRELDNDITIWWSKESHKPKTY